jgi:hypothetical protein
VIDFPAAQAMPISEIEDLARRAAAFNKRARAGEG